MNNNLKCMLYCLKKKQCLWEYKNNWELCKYLLTNVWIYCQGHIIKELEKMAEKITLHKTCYLKIGNAHVLFVPHFLNFVIIIFVPCRVYRRVQLRSQRSGCRTSLFTEESWVGSVHWWARRIQSLHLWRRVWNRNF